MAGATEIRPGVDDHLSARDDRVHMPGDLHTLVGGIVHVHVVCLDADPGAAFWIVNDYIRVTSRSDHPFAGVQPEHPGGCRGAQLHPPRQTDVTVDHPLVDEVHPMLDSPDTVGNLREVSDTELLLFLEAEGTV